MPSEREAIRRWLIDIRHHIIMAERFAEGMTYATFKDDNLHLYAVMRCLEIISEASRRLPKAFKERYPAIQWKNMAAAGNIYRHEYEDVAAREVWDTLTLHLPPLRLIAETELAALGAE
jgi:uncharacterized protein with HEPN domain